MIIFVDQRLVADLLYQVLKDEPKIKYKIDVVYSHSSRGILKKTLKKLKVDSEKITSIMEEIINVENVDGRSISMQRKTLDNFRKGNVKVLIATNVIEEGLDIPQCNKIVIYDKIQTPKTYIQMAGRARKMDSKIHFLCMDTEKHEVEKNIEVMQNYKDLLNANDRLSKINPRVHKDACTYPDNEMFIIPYTGARVSIDGSLDLMNMLIQKLCSKTRKIKLLEHFEEERQNTMYYKCIMKLKSNEDII